MKKYLLLASVALALASCVSTRNTIKNIDDKAVMPALTKDKTFAITDTATDHKYAYDADYPINLGFSNLAGSELNVERYFGALTGPEGQKLTYEKVDTCCPFPSKRNEMGAGLLDIYEVTWEGLTIPKKVYVNLYEKGKIMAPHGFGIKKG